MKFRWILLSAALCLGAGSAFSSPPSVVGVDCVSNANGCSNAIDHTDLTGSTYVNAAGYYAAGDNGGGNFENEGTCTTATGVSGTISGNQITGLGSATYLVGSLVSDTGGLGIPAGDQIAKYSSGTITLTVAITGPGGADTFTIKPNNGGTLVQDNATTPNCFVRLNYHGDPHEWGAFGNGYTDDSSALQNWLAGPGPWDASIPATYKTKYPLTCWPNINLRAPANDSHTGTYTPAPIVTILAAPGSFPNATPVLTADTYCRISGLAIDANDTGGTDNLDNALEVVGAGVVVDGHSLLENGSYNLHCDQSAGGDAGLQVKDSQIGPSWSDNIHLGVCPNVRLIGDIVSQAGKYWKGTGLVPAGVFSSGSDDLTLMGGVIEESQGIGLDLSGADLVSVTGMFIDGNGEYEGTRGGASGGAGIEIDGSKEISICGNHFDHNDEYPVTDSAQIRFGGSQSKNVTLCGNVYLKSRQTPPASTQYVYDATIPQAVTTSSLYESAQSQDAGVFSPSAMSDLLPFLQYSPGFPQNYISGLTLSNDPTILTRVDFAAGQAADSTNSTIITLPAGTTCDVDFANMDGLNALDTGTPRPNRSYFYFLVSQPDGSSPSCIASASTSPTLPAGYTLFRMVGALYTQQSTPDVVSFVQSDDTFSLVTSVAFPASGTVGTGSTPVTIGGIPSLISVQAFGRCTAGSAVMLAAGGITAQAPTSNFSSAPGYMVNSLMPNTSFPFSLYTTGLPTSSPPGGVINAAAATSGTSLQCSNDGWIWHRGK